MSHRAVIEAGPQTIRRLCCGAAEADAAEAALDWIDDPVALVDGQPAALPELLRAVLACPDPVESIEIIHPSWWPARRVQLFATAAAELTADVVTRTRAAVLGAEYPDAVVVEIAARLVAVTGPTGTAAAEPRIGSPETVAAAVARRVMADQPAAVLIDAPGEAAALAELIADRLRDAARVTVLDGLPPIPASETPEPVTAPACAVRGRPRTVTIVTVAAGLAVVALGLRTHPAPALPATYLVEGRVAVQVPTGWPVRRVAGGPGSARVEVASPTDPTQILHLAQAPAPGDTLAAVAEPLQRAVELADVETPGVFVDFDPGGSSAGRPAVTYREVRSGRQIDWVVLVDDAVRIGIGCQRGPGGGDMVRPVCEQAVRSAHALR